MAAEMATRRAAASRAAPLGVALLLLSALPSTSCVRIGGKSDDSEPLPLGKGKKAQAVSSSAVRTAPPDGNGAKASPRAEIAGSDTQGTRLLVVGSVNLDTIFEVGRLPLKGENIVATSANAATALGGKGANQAIAAARLNDGAATESGRAPSSVEFICQFGNDVHAERLERTLASTGVGLSACGHCDESASGQGLVFLEPDGGVSAVVLGGSNQAGWSDAFAHSLRARVMSASALLLQREIPEAINEVLARLAHEAGVPVIQDIGGEERPISDAMLALVTYLCPNETEVSLSVGQTPPPSDLTPRGQC